jgi:type VI protein secretion system component VasK
LDLANIERKSSRLYQMSWTFAKQNTYDVRVAYELRASSTNNPFKQGYLKPFSLPKKLTKSHKE